MKWKLLSLLILGIFIISFTSALPNPTLQSVAGWKVTSATGQEAQLTFWTSGTDKKVSLGWLPPDNSCLGWNDKILYGKNGLPIKDDKNKDITLKCETSKCLVGGILKNCYYISLTSAQAVNINDYVKLGNTSMTSEWFNSTLYVYNTDTVNLYGASLKLYYDDEQVLVPDLKWTSEQPIDKGIEFSANVNGFTNRNNITFLINNEQLCTSYRYYTSCLNRNWDFSKFESQNVITNKTQVQTVDGLKITYFGTIIDLDPALIEKYTTSTYGFYNQTQANTFGIGLNRSFTNSTSIYDFTTGDFKSLVFFNSTSTYWNTTLSIADTYSTRTGIINNKNEINLSHTNLVSYWKLDNNFVDATGRNNGACSGTECPTNVTGLSSNAMSLDGGDDRISVADSASLQLGTGNFTISAWVYPRTVDYGGSDQGTIYSKDYLGIEMIIYLSKFNVYMGGVPNELLGVQTLTTNKWYHLVVTRSGSSVTSYINGVVDSTVSNSASISNAGSAVNIGQRSSSSSFALDGIEDEVSVYNRSLTASEIQQLYKAGLSQHANTNVTLQYRVAQSYNITDPSLVSFWSFNNDNSTTVFDEKGINNGTRQGVIADANGGNGTVGNGYYFDGVNDYVNVSHSSSLDFERNSSFAFSFWIKTTDTGVKSFISKDLVGSPYTGINFFGGFANGANDAGKFTIRLVNTWSSNSIDVYSTSDTRYTDGSWHNYVLIYNGSSTASGVKLYEDGVNVPLTARYDSLTATIRNTDPFTIAETYPNGAIDEVRIYNRSLSASEVLDLYNLGSYHINWGSWDTEYQVVQDGVGTLSPMSIGQGKFMQFKANLNTNSTAVSPYILNHSVQASSTGYANSLINITIINPTTGTITNVTTQNFTGNITSLRPLANGTLWIYFTNGTLWNSTFFNNIAGLTQALVGIPVLLIEGVYNWFYSIIDNAGTKTSTANQTLTIDTTAPIVTLINPNASYVSTSNYVTFAYIVNNTPATTSITNLSLYIDGVLNFTWINPTSNIEINNYTKINYGVHNWTLTATDQANNIGTATASFTLGGCNCTTTTPAYSEINGSLVVYANQSLVIKACGS